MSDKKLEKLVKRSVEEFNDWRKSNPKTVVDLSGANFWMHDLTGVDLHEAVLRDTYFSYALLDDAVFRAADLTNSSLAHAEIGCADFTGANLNGCSMFDADIYQSLFLEAKLDGADLDATHLEECDMTGASAVGCENVKTAVIENCINVPKELQEVANP